MMERVSKKATRKAGMTTGTNVRALFCLQGLRRRMAGQDSGALASEATEGVPPPYNSATSTRNLSKVKVKCGYATTWTSTTTKPSRLGLTSCKRPLLQSRHAVSRSVPATS